MNNVTEDIINVGVDDRKIDLFEGMYRVPDGITYNSYVIYDDKIVVMDSVDAHFGEEWLDNLAKTLGDREPDYLIVQHVEPDHSGSIKAFKDKYPRAVLVGNQKTFVMLGEYFGVDYAVNGMTVKNGDKLSLGKHELTFLFAPMVHWPEVMFTYESSERVLFSADAFGSFGVAGDSCADWDDVARRYYIGIVGKFGVQVQSVLNKLAGYELSCICPLHGCAIAETDIPHAVEIYRRWASYEPEIEGTLIAYSSVYGHTKEAAELLGDELKQRGGAVKIVDLVRDDWSECVAQAFRYSKLVVASTTYNGGIFPAAREFIDRLTERNFRRRKIGFIENGTWAPVCAKQMAEKFALAVDLTFANTVVKVRSALNEESINQIRELANELSTHN